MTDYKDRQRQVLALAAETAYKLPRLESGFWFHQDMRDNLYYAMHLYAACSDKTLELSFNRAEGLAAGASMLQAVLNLQVKDPQHPMYGHWPLNLGSDPREAAPNTLPVELLGSLIAWFHSRYEAYMTEELRIGFEEAMRIIYLGNYYRKPAEQFGHHESKYTAQQLIWGELFQDIPLAEEGRRNLKLLLSTIKQNGMREYGSLPWFWHWVQAFSAARGLVKDQETLRLLEDMLQYLWARRAEVYLRGAWAGPHSRVLPHDIPADRNNLIDYVQFGDFALPASISRLEAAGLLDFLPANTAVIAGAVNRRGQSEIKRLIPVNPVNITENSLHSYVFLTPDYALGGIWERAEEYLNEQHRWDVTFPVRKDGTANKAFFFHPGNGYAKGDPRHQSPFCEAVFHKNRAAALYAIPEEASSTAIAGVLPHGEWLFHQRLIVGQVDDVYLIFGLMQDYTAESGPDYVEVHSEGRRNGVTVEVVDKSTAAALGLHDVASVAEAAGRAAGGGWFQHREEGSVTVDFAGIGDGPRLTLAIDGNGSLSRRHLDGQTVSFEDYTVPGLE
ncbi:MAG: hypothetical protein K0R57_6310 [Paenibacillaceae bacterium]|jgi:hypothetical protein|nr:hypothetical protein [Paenibacillaceae bacterium]